MIALGPMIKVSNVFKIKPKLMSSLPYPWIEKLTLGMDSVLDFDLGICFLLITECKTWHTSQTYVP